MKKSIGIISQKQTPANKGEYSFRKMEVTGEKIGDLSDRGHQKSVEEEKRASGVTHKSVSNSQPEQEPLDPKN